MKIRKIVSLFLSIVLVLVMISPITANAATSNAPNRVINLVYDDSGSMILTDGKKVDTWCQAKYAIEVFAALLGEKDTLNIYVMSDYSKPKLVLKGKSGASTNVKKVHNMVTTAGNTPFDSVRKAYNDLKDTKADEKWLVVLTDGVFQNIDDIDAYFDKKASNIKVLFLGMGPQADGIKSNESKDIFYREAKTNGEILKQVTDISTQIFNSDRLEVNTSSKSISFDVPMSELVVFAQGANVKINGIKDAEGKTFSGSSKPVTVKYSEKPATNYKDFIVAKDLVGSISTFKGNFAEGEYTIDVSGAETIEVYYKPNVEIAAYLKDADGKEVTDLTDLEAGEYTIEFSLVKGGTEEKITQSKLLGSVKYEAKVTNNGTTHKKTYTSGDKITLGEGAISIDITASYLDYNTVTTQLDYTIFKNKNITYEVLEEPNYIVNSNGFEENKPIVVKALLDGKEFTKEQWKSMGIPTVELAEKQSFKLENFKVEKKDKIGVFYIYPTFEGEIPGSGTYSDCNLKISYQEKYGKATWSGSGEVPIKMSDNRSWIVRNRDIFIKMTILGIILFFVVGYLPFVKCYLPKSLKKSPYIEGVSTMVGIPDIHTKGIIEKKFCTTVCPYVPQKGTIRYVPKGISGFPILSVTAIRGRKMSMTNIEDFAGKPNITFDGSPIDPDWKRYDMFANVDIRAVKDGWTYCCVPNEGKK